MSGYHFVSLYRDDENPYPNSTFDITDMKTGKVEHVRGLGNADRRFCELSNAHRDRDFSMERNRAELAAEANR